VEHVNGDGDVDSVFAALWRLVTNLGVATDAAHPLFARARAFPIGSPLALLAAFALGACAARAPAAPPPPPPT
jgi:hypothetical protein